MLNCDHLTGDQIRQFAKDKGISIPSEEHYSKGDLNSYVNYQLGLMNTKIQETQEKLTLEEIVLRFTTNENIPGILKIILDYYPYPQELIDNFERVSKDIFWDLNKSKAVRLIHLDNYQCIDQKYTDEELNIPVLYGISFVCFNRIYYSNDKFNNKETFTINFLIGKEDHLSSFEEMLKDIHRFFNDTNKKTNQLFLRQINKRFEAYEKYTAELLSGKSIRDLFKGALVEDIKWDPEMEIYRITWL